MIGVFFIFFKRDQSRRKNYLELVFISVLVAILIGFFDWPEHLYILPLFIILINVLAVEMIIQVKKSQKNIEMRIVDEIWAVLLILVSFSLFFISETDFSGTFLNDILILIALILFIAGFLLNKKKK